MAALNAPISANAPVDAALAAHLAGNLDDAAHAYAQAARAVPEWAVLSYLQAAVARQRGQAVAPWLDLARRQPAPAWEHAINAARALIRLSQPDLAREVLGRLLAGTPEPEPAQCAILTPLLLNAQAPDHAAVVARHWHRLAPDDADATNALAVAYNRLGRQADALALYDKALLDDPDQDSLRYNRALSLHQQGEWLAAIADLLRLRARAPDRAAYAYLQAMTLIRMGDASAAEAAFADTVASDPDHLLAHVALIDLSLAPVYPSTDALAEARSRFARRLAAAEAAFARTPPAAHAQAAEAFRLCTTFLLPYQGENDRELQRRFSALVAQAARARCPQWAARPAAPPRRERLRIGIVSAWLCGHSNWKIPIRGWVRGLDPQRFELIAYAVGQRRDEVTEAEIKPAFAAFVDEPETLEGWADRIGADAPDVLIYPEIGMDGLTQLLAALRLAPVQVSSWGHPQTSGLDSIDYYLSSDAMEPADGQDAYTEALVRLPGLSIAYAPSALPARPFDLAAAGVRNDSVRYLCLQNSSKYLPQRDGLLVAIARALPEAQFLLLDPPAALQQRLAAAFSAAGLDPGAHLVFLPRLLGGAYAYLNSVGDVFLDSVDWSGCNSTLEAIQQGTPVVCQWGRWMRGRHSAAILQQMGLDDLIAADDGAYVALAVRLGRDRAFRAEVSSRLHAERHRLFHDPAPVAALAAFLEESIAMARTEPAATALAPAGSPSHSAPQQAPADPRAILHSALHADQLAHHVDVNAHSARTLLGQLFTLMQPRSVLDVGCGLGTWLRIAGTLGVSDRQGIEAEWTDPALLEIPADLIARHDLERSFDLGRRFDLVITLEVAEHLRAEAAAGFVDSLALHGDVVLFSAAIPGQGGHNHVNEQFVSYWAALFAARGYQPVDCLRAGVWSDPTIHWWLRQNLLVFANDAGLARWPLLAERAEITRAAGPIDVVHPDIYRDRLSRLLGELRELRQLRDLLGRGGTFEVMPQPGGQLTVKRRA